MISNFFIELVNDLFFAPQIALITFRNLFRFQFALWPLPRLFTVFIPQRYADFRHFYAPL